MRCPAPEELSAFAQGDLDEETLERVARHVETCNACGVALDGQHPDELVEVLRELAEDSDPTGEEVPAFLVETARDTFARDRGEVVVDAGQKLSRSLAEGPHRLGKFELQEELGAGSFGYVFRARDTDLDRTVAIKIQRAGLPDHAEEKVRFLREARSAAQLRHPGIVSVHETGETEEGVGFLVTEFVDGDTLEASLQHGPFKPREAARITASIARALDAAHEHGVVHRDVKPSNVMLDRSGDPRVMDFGLAKRDTQGATDAAMTPQGAVMGTPAYMSPEMARGEAHNADARSDVYSLGVVLYELLTGERPFRGNRRMLMLQVLEDDPRPPHKLDDAIPRDLDTITLHAMQKARARRYPTARAFAEDLERFLTGKPIHARAAGPVELLWRWCKRNQLVASLFAAVVLAAAIGFWHLSRLSTELVESAALDSAVQYSEMLEVVNELYSSEVVQRLGHHGIEATADYAAEDGGIPVPATLLTVLLERISEGKTGMRGRHYSEFPFRTRSDGGPRTQFEREALRRLVDRPDQPYYRFVEDYEGRPALLFATARRMQQSCVDCHNTHPDSTKRDWIVGDVRGVLEIIRPLEHDVERTSAGLSSSFAIVGGVAAASLLAFASIAFVGRRRRGSVVS